MARYRRLAHRVADEAYKVPVWGWVLLVLIVGIALLYALYGSGPHGGLKITLQDIADIFSVASIVAAALIIPYSVGALLKYERITIRLPFGLGKWNIKAGNRRVVRTHRNRRINYGPSLFITTWLTRAFLLGIIIILAVVLLRAALHYEAIGEQLTPQPAWSLTLSFCTSLVILVLFNLPATFLLWVKNCIVENPYLPSREREDSEAEEDEEGEWPED